MIIHDILLLMTICVVTTVIVILLVSHLHAFIYWIAFSYFVYY
jgi:hypothetical protein